MQAAIGRDADALGVRAHAAALRVRVQQRAGRACATCGGTGQALDTVIAGPILRAFRVQVGVGAWRLALRLATTAERVGRFEAGADGHVPPGDVDAYLAAVVALATAEAPR